MSHTSLLICLVWLLTWFGCCQTSNKWCWWWIGDDVDSNLYTYDLTFCISYHDGRVTALLNETTKHKSLNVEDVTVKSKTKHVDVINEDISIGQPKFNIVDNLLQLSVDDLDIAQFYLQHPVLTKDIAVKEVKDEDEPKPDVLDADESYFDLVTFLMNKIISCKHKDDRICTFDELIWISCDEFNKICYWEPEKYKYSMFRNELQLEIVQEILVSIEQVNSIGDIWFNDREIHECVELCLRFISQLLQYTESDWSDQYHSNWDMLKFFSIAIAQKFENAFTKVSLHCFFIFVF